MSWVAVFAGFLVAHMVGDYLLQTDWQARHKRCGLGGDRVALRALLTHVTTYTLAFVPALIWLAGEEEVSVLGAIGLGALVFVPHLIQDDGRLLTSYIARVKGCSAATTQEVFQAVDQTFHLVTLFGIALLAVA